MIFNGFAILFFSLIIASALRQAQHNATHFQPTDTGDDGQDDGFLYEVIEIICAIVTANKLASLIQRNFPLHKYLLTALEKCHN